MNDFRVQPEGYDQGMYAMTFEEYTSIPALNSSKLKHMRRSPAHYKTALDAGEPVFTAQQVRTMAKGTAFDIFVLGGGLQALKDAVSVEPDTVNRRTKDYQVWKSAQDDIGKMILTANEFKNVVEMADAAGRKRQFAKLFGNGYPHRVMVWQDRCTRLWCKAELDWLTEDGIIVDLKSTADAGFWFFSKNSRRLGYPNQAAHYLAGLSTITGVRHNEFYFAAVEVDPPFESHVFKPSNFQLDEAFDQNEYRMDRLLGCLENGEWPGYLDQVMCLETGHYFEDFLNDEETDTYGF